MTDEEKELLGNPKKLSDDQGFYIYRNKRLIILGSWLRMFLNLKGNVNKEIRYTILHEKENFFAYNNGISTTADSIETEIVNGVPLITKLNNFQIINGVQTTATLAATMIKEKVDLSNIYVQMKLTILKESEI